MAKNDRLLTPEKINSIISKEYDEDPWQCAKDAVDEAIGAQDAISYPDGVEDGRVLERKVVGEWLKGVYQGAFYKLDSGIKMQGAIKALCEGRRP